MITGGTNIGRPLTDYKDTLQSAFSVVTVWFAYEHNKICIKSV